MPHRNKDCEKLLWKLYAKKFENQGEMHKFLEKYDLPKLSEEAESQNWPIIADEIEAVIKNSWHTKALVQTVSQGNSTKHLRRS